MYSENLYDTLARNAAFQKVTSWLVSLVQNLHKEKKTNQGLSHLFLPARQCNLVLNSVEKSPNSISRKRPNDAHFKIFWEQFWPVRTHSIFTVFQLYPFLLRHFIFYLLSSFLLNVCGIIISILFFILCTVQHGWSLPSITVAWSLCLYPCSICIQFLLHSDMNSVTQLRTQSKVSHILIFFS